MSFMTTWRDRQREVLFQTANEAWEQPLLTSGFWTHGDIRNNYYLASYLIAAVADSELELSYDRGDALAKASDVMTRVLLLQDVDPESATYGHWPLSLGETPVEAPKNTLPAEIMGCLLAYCHKRYASILPAELSRLVEQTMEALYRSTYYRTPLTTFGHHEAKYTASKLIFGHRYADQELMDIGHNDLVRTLDRVRELGMPEYGALPWFWHWIQAYTCTYECLPEGEARSRVAELLDELWNYRATYYLQGAWAGGRMRSLAHDLPRDGNVAFDYVQFGNFELPTQLPRVEYAGLLFYQAPEQAMETALRRDELQLETKRIITPAKGEDVLHSYLYVEKSFAAGGIWERVKEFDNEQHRWEITFPLFTDGSVNRMYIFSPGDGNKVGDPRHASEGGEVLFHRSTVVAMYPSRDELSHQLVGVLPLGEWVQEQGALYGLVHDVYIALYTQGIISIIERSDRLSIECVGNPNGIVVDVISAATASEHSIRSLVDFVRVMEVRKPEWNIENVTYESISGDRLQLDIQDGRPSRMINGSPVDFEAYSTPGQSTSIWEG